MTAAGLSGAVVVLLRHGEAVSETVDPARPLSKRGRRETERIARWAAAAGLRVSEIRHSGKRRAAETAEIMARELKPPGGVIVVEGLHPDDDIVPVARELERVDQPVLLVGHLPFLGRLAAHLLTDHAGQPRVAFPPSGLAALAREGERWTLLAVVSPDSLD